MGVLDQLARAEVSSDLAHHDRHCDVDVLGAAGMATAANPRHMAIFRAKYLYDEREVHAAKRYFIQLARIHMIRRKVDPAKASRIGSQIFTYWMDDTCPSCKGRKYQVIDGSPSLSDRQCNHCDGSGKRKLPYKGAELEVVRDVLDRADIAVNAIRRGVAERLKDNA